MNSFPNRQSKAPIALVVETNTSLRRLTATILRQKSFRVIEARSEQEAEELFMTSPEPVALLLAGYDSTEEASGLALALCLREQAPDLKILLFGAFAPAERETLHMRLAGIHFLSLPFSFGRFSQVLGEVRSSSPSFSLSQLPFVTVPKQPVAVASAV